MFTVEIKICNEYGECLETKRHLNDKHEVAEDIDCKFVRDILDELENYGKENSIDTK